MDILLINPCSSIKNNIHAWLKNHFGSTLKVFIAMNYATALKIIRREHVDIILAKAGQGECATHALQEFLAEVAGSSKVIIYASHDVSVAKENPYKHGVDGFISMWDIPDSLILCIKRVMRGFSYQSPLFI